MRRPPPFRLALGLLLGFLCACGEGIAPPPGSSPVEHIAAGFEGLNDVIVVRAIDRQPLRSAVLVDPDGERTDSYSLDVDSSPTLEPSAAGRALAETPGMVPQVTRLHAMVATALIRLPDPTRYAKTWQSWHIELALGDPESGGRAVTLPAPAPRNTF